MSTLAATDLGDIDRANSSGKRPVVLVHGLWLLSSSWDRWRARLEEDGYVALAPGWPDDPETIEAARANPEVFAKKMVRAVTNHYLDAVSRLEVKPAVVGHSFGGLIAQQLAGQLACAATVAIDPAPFRGVLPVPFSSLRSSSAVIGNPANAGRAVTLSFEAFQYGWANNLDETEARDLYQRYHVAASGRPIFQAVSANINPFTQIKVRTKVEGRGPMLLIAGEKDHTVPPSIVKASYKRQRRNSAPTEYVELPGRGHSLTIDHGWTGVAEATQSFLHTHYPASPAPAAG